MLSIDALHTFTVVIDSGSFSAAAVRLDQTPSGVSRTIARLEKQLGVALIQRTTRRFDLTEEGRWLLERARKLLAELHDTEQRLNARLGQVAGLVRVNAATPVLDHLIAPLAAAFMDAYPLVRLELVSGETIVDLIEHQVDVAIRIGVLVDSSLTARPLGSSALRVLASPAYLARHGVPQRPEQLAQHRLLGFTEPASLNLWPLLHGGAEGWPVTPALAASSGETVRHLALRGAGIACLADFLSRDDVASGRLVPVLATHTLPWTQPIWAVFYRQGALAPRVAALIDFVALRMQDASTG